MRGRGGGRGGCVYAYTLVVYAPPLVEGLLYTREMCRGGEVPHLRGGGRNVTTQVAPA